MTEYVTNPREVHPDCKLPSDLDTPVWRYMSISKFESLLTKKALYLCSAQHLQDRFEGTFSTKQIRDNDDWCRENGVPDVIISENEHRKKDRLSTYISCWCMYSCDLDLMWKGYVNNLPGVAIKSSIRKLQKICDNAVAYWPLDISVVKYFDHANGEPIDYIGTPTTFLYKDHHFRLDNELRIIHHPNISSPPPKGIFLPVDLSVLIETVVIKPGADTNDLQFVQEALKKAELTNIQVSLSRDDREVIE